MRYLCLFAAAALFSLPTTVSADERVGYLYLSDGTVEVITSATKERLFGGDEKGGEVLVESGITWNVDFQDFGTGQGFDSPVLGLQRRQALRAAIAYVSDVLNEPGGVIDLNVQSFSQNSGTLATCGPVVFGFNGGAVNNGGPFQHLKNPNVDPTPGSPDMQMRVNFFHPYNLAASLPLVGEFDLRSILIHELTHGLGFLSSMAFQEGNGELCFNGGGRTTGRGWFNQQPDNYCQFDLFLQTGNGNVFLQNFLFIGQNSFFLGGDSGVFFNGPQATAAFGGPVPVFTTDPQTPNLFECGSSMSHFEFGTNAVMEAAVAPQLVRREYQDFEIGTLRDLGYTNAAEPGGGEGEGEGDGEPGDCELQSVAITQPGNTPIQIGQGNVQVNINLRASVTFEGEPGCTEGSVRVTYFVNNVNAGNSQNTAGGFPVAIVRGAGNFQLRAEATLLSGANAGQTVTTQKTVTVLAAEESAVTDVSPDGTVDFGEVEAGNSGQTQFTVTNTGGGTLSGSANVSGTGYSILGAANYSLDANESAVVTVQFAPGGEGTFAGLIAFGGGSNGAVQVNLTGTGVVTKSTGCGAGGGRASRLGDVLTLLVAASAVGLFARRRGLGARG